MKKNSFLLASMACLMPIAANAQGNNENKVDLTPQIHGTIRGKYEYQTEEGEAALRCAMRVSASRVKWRSLWNIRPRLTSLTRVRLKCLMHIRG